MAKQELDWQEFTLSDTAPETVKDADIDMETASELAKKAKATIAAYVATKVKVPAGHEVVIMRKYGAYRYATAPIPKSRAKAGKVAL